MWAVCPCSLHFCFFSASVSGDGNPATTPTPTQQPTHSPMAGIGFTPHFSFLYFAPTRLEAMRKGLHFFFCKFGNSRMISSGGGWVDVTCTTVCRSCTHQLYLCKRAVCSRISPRHVSKRGIKGHKKGGGAKFFCCVCVLPRRLVYADHCEFVRPTRERSGKGGGARWRRRTRQVWSSGV